MMPRIGVASAWAVLAFALTLAGCARNQAVNNAPQQGSPEANAQARARIHTELSAGYYTRGQHDVALEELNEALRIDSTFAPAYGMLGLVYSELRDDARAERNFQRAIELNPQDPEVRNNYGWFLCQRAREPQSLGQFELAVNNPFYRTPDMALVNAGRCAAKLGDRKGAEGYLQRALSLAPSNSAAHTLLASLAYKAGEYDAARARMRTVMAIPGPSPEALLLGVCIEKRFGDKSAETTYATQLKLRYPNAAETKLADAGSCP
jgi:type IV pilus assembly protein PilF